jgi:hypothetical protein
VGCGKDLEAKEIELADFVSLDTKGEVEIMVM